MLSFARILCPVDFSEFSTRAYDYAHSLALHYGATLIVLHVTEPLISIYRGYMTQTLIDEVYASQAADAREQVRKLGERHQVEPAKREVIVQVGPVPDTILAFAEVRDIDLVVMGTHGRRGFDRLALGSAVEAVLRKARCPVLAIRHPRHDFIKAGGPDAAVELRKILCCVDFSEYSPRALEYAFSLAWEYHAEVALLHVLEDPRSATELERETGEVLDRLKALVPIKAENRATILPVVRTGKPYQEIMQYATEAHTDLTVMGVRGRNAVDMALFGSTAHRVIQLGPSPVLVVRA